MDERLFIWPGTTYLWLHHQRKTPFPQVLNGNNLPGGPHPCEMLIGPILCKFCADNLSFMWVHGRVMPRRCLSAAQFLSSALTAFCPLISHSLNLRDRRRPVPCGAKCSTITCFWLFDCTHLVSELSIFVFKILRFLTFTLLSSTV